jgi:hypothetical protein
MRKGEKKNMSLTQRIIEALEAGLWKFVRIVHTTNHDFPYHDYFYIENESSTDTLIGSYAIGANNKDRHGDQSKLFVSKHTVPVVIGGETTFEFNDSRNVVFDFNVNTMDFYCNVNVLFYSIGPTNKFGMFFEGVLPEEARDAR